MGYQMIINRWTTDKLQPHGPSLTPAARLNAAASTERADLPVHVGSVAVQSAVGVFPPQAVVLQDVQHARHLAEYQHAMSLLTEPWQQLIQHHHLARVTGYV